MTVSKHTIFSERGGLVASGHQRPKLLLWFHGVGFSFAMVMSCDIVRSDGTMPREVRL
jgi:hypothetical protein